MNHEWEEEDEYWDDDEYWEDEEDEEEGPQCDVSRVSFDMPDFDSPENSKFPISSNGHRIRIGDTVKVISISNSKKNIYVTSAMHDYVGNDLTYTVKSVAKVDRGWTVKIGNWNWSSGDLHKMNVEAPQKPMEPIMFDPSLLDLG